MRTRGEGGLNMTKNTHLVRRLIENATISEMDTGGCSVNCATPFLGECISTLMN